MTKPLKQRMPARPQPGPKPRQKRAGRLVLSLIVLLALLLPVGYIIDRQWTVTGDAANFVSTERTGVAYARPLTTLLAALVDAENAAARGAAVDTNAVKEAVDGFNTVDKSLSDPLRLRQGWEQLSSQIDQAVGQRVSGQEAVRVYGAPIGLAMSLLTKVGDYSKIVRDPGLDAYHLMDAALFRVPEVLVYGGQVGAVAGALDPRTGRPASAADPRIGLAQDHVATAGSAISVGLRAGADSGGSEAVDLDLLKPLDEFAAATDALGRTTVVPDLSSAAVQSDIDTARRRLHAAAVNLDAALLKAFDALLGRRANQISSQRQGAFLAGMLAVLATVALMWLRLPSPSTPEPAGRPGGGAGPPESAQGRPDYAPELVDARDLLATELVHVGRGVRTHRRQEHNVPR